MISFRKSDLIDKIKKRTKLVLVINATDSLLVFEFIDKIEFKKQYSLREVIEDVVRCALTEVNQDVYTVKAYDLPSDSHADTEMYAAKVCDRLNSIFGTKSEMVLTRNPTNNGYVAQLHLTEEQIDII